MLLLLLVCSLQFVTSLRSAGPSAVTKLQGSKKTRLQAANTPVSADAVGDSKLTSFLADAASLGPIRFVVVGTGAILVGTMIHFPPFLLFLPSFLFHSLMLSLTVLGNSWFIY